MGQCYDSNITIKFKNNDPKKFCAAIKNKMTQMHNNRDIQLNEYQIKTNWNDPLECLKAVASNENEYIYSYKENGTYHYESEFYGSYGWEWAMGIILEDAAKYCDNDSVLEFCADMSGQHTIKVMDGQVSHTYKEI